jgi:arylsulfatase
MTLSRRSFLEIIASTAAIAALPTTNPAHSQTSSTAPAPKRPNIVLIMADDMGFSDIGCYGSEIKTPNLDALAANGTRFTQFYNTGRCCPTRASLLTGLYSHQAGVGMMDGDHGLPGYRGFISERSATLAEMLKTGGYKTLMVGKWHVGANRPHWPVDRGFDRYYGLVDGGSSYFSIDKGRTFVNDDRKIDPVNEDFYVTDAFSDAAVNYVAEYAPKPEPFFLYLAYTAPHFPLHARKEDIAKYRGQYKIGWDKLREQRYARQLDMGLIDRAFPLAPRNKAVNPRDRDGKGWEKVENVDEEDLKMAVYAAQIDRMDQGIGRLIAKLKETGTFENTLILFCSDNGGCAESGNRPNRPSPEGTGAATLAYGVPWAAASNTPFRRYKRWVHEGGIVSPFIAHWPGHAQAGVINTRQVGHVIDLAPTCLEAAGIAQPKTLKDQQLIPIEGKSLVSAFGKKSFEREAPLFWEHMGNRAVRLGKWKLVSESGSDWELYDMQADRTELNNLAPANPDKVKEMTALWQEWAKRCNVVPFDQLKNPKRPAE